MINKKRPFKNTFAGLIAIFCFFNSSTSFASTVDFEDIPAFESQAPFTSGELNFSGSSLTYVWTDSPDGAKNGTQSLITGFSSTLTIAKVGGGLFNIEELDAGLSFYTSDSSFDITVTSYDSSAIILSSEVITLDQSFQTFSFSNLTNVSSVTIGASPSDGYIAIDNIVMSAVPVPAAFWLMGSGIIGLISFSRNKK